MVNFGYDLIIIAIICALGAVSFKLAYWQGAPVWSTQFATSLPAYPPARMCSGQVGELANLLLIAAILLLLLILTPDANIYGFVTAQWPWVLPALMVIAALVTIYTRIAVSSIKFRPAIEHSDDNIGLLSRGYVFYIGYCLAVSLLIVIIFVMTIHQIQIDFNRFQIVQDGVGQLMNDVQRMRWPQVENLQIKFEVIYGMQRIAVGHILDQVNSLLMLLLCVMLAYATIYGTGIRQVFADEALSYLRMLVMILVAICLIYGCTLFFTLHITFVDGLRNQLSGFEVIMNRGPWEVTRRFHELQAELSQQRGIFGFLVALTTGRGGLILVAPVAGYFLRKALPSEPKSAPA